MAIAFTPNEKQPTVNSLPVMMLTVFQLLFFFEASTRLKVG